MSQAVITSAFNELLKNLKISGDSLVKISIETTKTKKGDEKMKISMSFPLQSLVTNSIGQEPSQPAVAPIQPEEEMAIIKKTEQYSSQHADLKKTMAQEKEELEKSSLQNPVNETLASNPSSDDDDIPGIYECPFCDRIFSYYNDLDIHMYNTCARSKHFMENKYSTHLHQEHNMAMTMLEEQITDEKHKKYACNFCDRRFTFAYIQEAHMSKCSKKNKSLDETVDKEKTHMELPDNSKSNTEKRFTCEVYNKEYKHQASMKTHLMSHKSKEEESNTIVSKMQGRAEKPFTCQDSKRHFNFKENMDHHMENHNTENRIGWRRFNLTETSTIQHRFQQIEEDPKEKKNKCFFCAEHFATDAELLAHCLNHH